MKTAIWCYFPLSAGISPHGRYRHMASGAQWRHLEVDATGRDRVCGWLLVGYHVNGVSRPGRVGDSDPQRPSTGCVWRPILHFTYNVQLGEWGFVRWIGVNPGWFSREETRLWRCFPHSTNKRMCIERTIKKVVVVHPQGTSCVINNRMPNALHFFFTFYALRRLLPATPSTQCL
jgi:hypothetical protein